LDNQHTFKPEIFIYYAERRLVPKHAELLTSLFAFIIERPTTTILALPIPNKRKWNRQADRKPNSQANNIRNINQQTSFNTMFFTIRSTSITIQSIFFLIKHLHICLLFQFGDGVIITPTIHR
jgi:hypothetical protein